MTTSPQLRESPETAKVHASLLCFWAATCIKAVPASSVTRTTDVTIFIHDLRYGERSVTNATSNLIAGVAQAQLAQRDMSGPEAAWESARAIAGQDENVWQGVQMHEEIN